MVKVGAKAEGHGHYAASRWLTRNLFGKTLGVERGFHQMIGGEPKSYSISIQPFALRPRK
jgi:hypothetical protein